MFPHWSCTFHVFIFNLYVFIFESHNFVLFLVWKLDLDLSFKFFSYGSSCPWHSPTWTMVYPWCNHADGGGVGFKINSKCLWEAKTNVVIMCSFYNASQLPCMYWRKWTRVSWWVFSPSYGGKNKHQKGNNKKTCQTVISKRSNVNQDKGICKAQLEVLMEYDGKNEDAVNPNGKHQWYLWMQSMSMLKKEDNMAKSGATFPLTYIHLWVMHET